MKHTALGCKNTAELFIVMGDMVNLCNYAINNNPRVIQIIEISITKTGIRLDGLLSNKNIRNSLHHHVIK